MVEWPLDPSQGFYANDTTSSLNAQDIDGCDALYVACLYRNALVVKAICQHPLCQPQRSTGGEFGIHALLSKVNRDTVDAEFASIDCVEAIRKHVPAQLLHVTNQGKTILHLATEGEIWLRMFRTLVKAIMLLGEKGAKVLRQRDAAGNTPLLDVFHHKTAARYGRILREKGYLRVLVDAGESLEETNKKEGGRQCLIMPSKPWSPSVSGMS